MLVVALAHLLHALAPQLLEGLVDLAGRLIVRIGARPAERSGAEWRQMGWDVGPFRSWLKKCGPWNSCENEGRTLECTLSF